MTRIEIKGVTLDLLFLKGKYCMRVTARARNIGFQSSDLIDALHSTWYSLFHSEVCLSEEHLMRVMELE